MSIVRAAARMALVEALKGRTLVGSNVLDSLIGGITFDAEGVPSLGQSKPFAGVYSDSSTADAAATQHRGLHANGMAIFVIEFGVAAVMAQPVSADSGEELLPEIGIPPTDSGMEITLDIVARQMFDALHDPSNAWSMVFRNLLDPISKLERSRVGNENDGVRLAGQQIRISGDLADDPALGEELDPESALSKLFVLAAASSDPDLVEKGSLLSDLIAGTPVNDAALFLRLTGMTAIVAEALGPGAYEGGDPDQVMHEATIETPIGETVTEKP